MYNDDEWVNKATDFLTDIFDGVSKGFQQVADELDKNCTNGFTYSGDDASSEEPKDKEENVENTARPESKPYPPFGRPRPGFGGGHRPAPETRRPVDAEGKRVRSIRADIIERDDNIEICAVLPGFAKENIDVFVKGEALTITATKDWRLVEEKEKYVSVEQRYGRFERSFPIGKVDAASIKASYKDGILHVTIAKLPEEVPSKISID